LSYLLVLYISTTKCKMAPAPCVDAMKRMLKAGMSCLLFGMTVFVYSCKKGDSGDIIPIDPVVTLDTTGTLKSKASFPIGMAMRADIAGSVPAYFSTAVRESSWVTFENELKNDFVLQADGTYNFAGADAFYQKCVAAGLEVYGHTLVWHSQQRANIYNAQIQAAVNGAAADSNVQAGVVDSAMHKHIEAVVGHYKGKIKAWDVINEPFTEAGLLRNNLNTPITSSTFIWQNYLGESYAEKAFRYAHAADPAAALYMNEYNLESSSPKLTAFVNLAKKLKEAGAPITGVGTQMHVLYTTQQKGIDLMFQELASTGLKVRISELDVHVNVNDAASYKINDNAASIQAGMYQKIVNSYLKYVPESQRAGIFIWGVNDTYNWLNTSTRPDAATLFDADFRKKPAFYSLLLALQGKP
jgi:GH35 family endo-1,4-beta-xylanase